MTQSDLTLPAVPAAGGQPTRAGSPSASGSLPGDPAEAVTALYHAQAVNLIRFAALMLGDAGRAEDIVQEVFLGLYRRWAQLADPGKAMQYVRTAVLNGCRTAMRPGKRRERAFGLPAALPAGIPGDAADATALVREQRRAVLTALRMLPRRQLEGRAGLRLAGRRLVTPTARCREARQRPIAWVLVGSSRDVIVMCAQLLAWTPPARTQPA
jgi:hypothetical protein